MITNIRYTNITKIEAVEDYILKKLEALNKFKAILGGEENSVVANVEVGRISKHHLKGDVFRAEINLSVKGKIFRAVSEKGDLFSAIDDMQSEVVREVRKTKNRQSTLTKKGNLEMKRFLKRNPS